MDGLDKNWEEGVPSCWERYSSNHEKRNSNSLPPFAISKLNKQFSALPNTNPINKDHDTVEKNEHHFDIRFKQNDIVWPYRKNTAQKV